MTRNLLLFCVIAMVMAGCTSDDPGSQPSDSVDPLDAAIAAEVTEPAGELSMQDRGPDAVVACMQDFGFDYWPEAPVTIGTELAGDSEDDLSRAWVEEHGLGASTSTYEESQVPGLRGRSPSDAVDTINQNEQYLVSLSPSDLEAYETALYGSVETPDFALYDGDELRQKYSEYQAAIEDAGCIARLDERTPEQRAFEELKSGYTEQIDDMYFRIESDQRVIDLFDRVRECVRGKGFSGFDNVVIATEEMFERASAISAEKAAGGGSSGALSSEELLALGQLQQEEIELALAVFDCGGGLAEQEKLFLELEAEYQKELVDELFG